LALILYQIVIPGKSDLLILRCDVKFDDNSNMAAHPGRLSTVDSKSAVHFT